MSNSREEGVVKILTLATVVAGIGINVLVALGGVGGGFLGLLFLQFGAVLLAAFVSGPVLVCQGSVTDSTVVGARVDGLTTRVRVRRKDVRHGAATGRGVDSKQEREEWWRKCSLRSAQIGSW